MKINEDVNPGIATALVTPGACGLNISPIKCENAIQATAVMTAPNSESVNVTLLAFTNGPDQKAIPVNMELYPNNPKVTSP